jgi:hypothetical protein
MFLYKNYIIGCRLYTRMPCRLKKKEDFQNYFSSKSSGNNSHKIFFFQIINYPNIIYYLSKTLTSTAIALYFIYYYYYYYYHLNFELNKFNCQNFLRILHLNLLAIRRIPPLLTHLIIIMIRFKLKIIIMFQVNFIGVNWWVHHYLSLIYQ